MGRGRVLDSWLSGWFRTSLKGRNEAEQNEVGILAYEVVSLMSKMVKLWGRLSDREIARLKEEISSSVGIRKLVSENDEYLMDLALDEIVGSLGMVAGSVARLGKKCADPVYHRLELFWSDPVQHESEWCGWAYKWKKMESKVKKMERFVAVTDQLSQELEVLEELEQALRGMHASTNSDQVKLLEFQQKVFWQRREVRNLEEMSPWTKTYDYTVRLLTKSLFTILDRIKHVFKTSRLSSVDGNNDCEHLTAHRLPRSHSFSVLMHSSVHPFENSGPLKSVIVKEKNESRKGSKATLNQPSILHGKHTKSKSRQLASVGPLKGCMMGSSESPILHSCKPAIGGSMRLSNTSPRSPERVQRKSIGSISCSERLYSKISLFNSRHWLLTAPPGTLGDAALALQYANVILLIEQLASAPHLIGLDARDELYNMLPRSVKTALRARLKSYAKTSIHASLVAEWSLALVRILEWLAPLAHNMIRWQSERNFERQQVTSVTNVLLVQTLYFASLSKTEAAITELLVGLNYICRINRDASNHVKQLAPDYASCRATNAHLIQEGEVAIDALLTLSQ